VLEGLTESQRKAVTHPGGPLLVLAGAGSGKTRVITTRVAHLVRTGVEPWRIVAVTFTNKAANEMKERVGSLLGKSAAGVTLRTFHSLCARVLRRFADKLGYTGSFSILDDRGSRRIIKQTMKMLEVPSAQFKPSGVQDMISRIKGAGETPETYLEFADGYRRMVIAKIYRRYQEALLEQNCMDFDDLLVNTIAVFKQEAQVLEMYQDRILHLLIDEYQDTNRVQYLIAKHLSGKHKNICVAGDPDQSIYGWRGAEISNILDFTDDYPDTTVVKLEENWRSCGAILINAQSVIQNNKLRQEKALLPTRETGPNVRVFGCYDEAHEAEAIVDEIMELCEGKFSYSDIALLYRTNAFSRSLEEKLRKAKIPYQVVAGIEFYNRREIKDLVLYLDFLVNPQNNVSFERIINTPPRGLGKKALDTIRALAKKNNISLSEALQKAASSGELTKRALKSASAFLKLIERLKAMLEQGPKQVLKEIIARTGYEDYISRQESGQDRLENIAELLNAAARFSLENPKGTTMDYVEQVALIADIDGYGDKASKVSLMTLHSAKGLEFPAVFVCGLEDGLLPHHRAIEDGRPSELEEERRLLYVGMTRAKDRLFLTLSKYRGEYGEPRRQIESRFLSELDMSHVDLVDLSEDY
jgi:DNA helicase-2/ATP-dependent DNA helicase PcrA